jgi:ABC-type glutathione transport system ATPase component
VASIADRIVTMHDGRIVEDRRLVEPAAEPALRRG